MKLFWKRFFLCGITGWSWECLFTGLGSLLQKDYKLTSQSSLWMFPIYGMACLICPIYQKIKKHCVFFRAFVYGLLIFFGEFLSGYILKTHHVCPWNYDHAKMNIQGIIRLDYLPAWMLAGILFEKIVLKIGCNPPCDKETNETSAKPSTLDKGANTNC